MLAAAIDAVKQQKMKVAHTAKKYDISVATLYDNTKGRKCKIGAGAPTVLTVAKESR